MYVGGATFWNEYRHHDAVNDGDHHDGHDDLRAEAVFGYVITDRKFFPSALAKAKALFVWSLTALFLEVTPPKIQCCRTVLIRLAVARSHIGTYGNVGKEKGRRKI